MTDSKQFVLGALQFLAASQLIEHYFKLSGARYWACVALCLCFKLFGWYETRK